MAERTSHWGKGAPIDVFEELKHLMYDIMGKVIFSGAWSKDENGATIIQTHRFLIEGSASLGLSFCDKFTMANLLKMPSDYRNYQAAIKKLQGIMWNMIEQRRKEVQENPKKWEADKSCLTVLVREKDEQGKPYFDKDLAIASGVGLLNGAYDTTHITTVWLMYNLARHPEIQEKVIAEIDTLGKPDLENLPTYDKLRELKYLDAAIRESIRLRMTVPLGMRGNYKEDVQVGNVTVPKGTTILPFTQGAHTNPKFAPAYFGDDVDKFRPERFMGESPEATKARAAFHGFGAGFRMCIGFKFAEVELKAIFVYFLQRYNIGLADPNASSPQMLYESGCNAPKEHFSLCFKPRA
jgi:cytochrome P450